MRHDLGERGVHQGQDPLARPAGTVLAGLQGLEHQRHRRPQDQEDRHHHRQHHVLDHVRGEQHQAVDGDPTGGDVEQHRQPDQPGEAAQHRPGVPAPADLHERPQVEGGEEDHYRQPERVHPPGGEPGGGGGLGRQWVPGEDLGRGGIRGDLLGHRWGGAGQGYGHAHDRTHDQYLPGHQLPHGTRGGEAAGLQGRDQPPAVSHPRQTQPQGQGGLEQHQLPVRAEQLFPGSDAHRRIDGPGKKHQEEGTEGHRGEAPQHHGGYRHLRPHTSAAAGPCRQAAGAGSRSAQLRGEPGEHHQPTGPQTHAQQVQAQGVHRTHMVRASGGVTGQGHRHQSRARQAEGEQQPHQGPDAEDQGGDHGSGHHGRRLRLPQGKIRGVVQQLLRVGLVPAHRHPRHIGIGQHQHHDGSHRPHHRRHLGQTHGGREQGVLRFLASVPPVCAAAEPTTFFRHDAQSEEQRTQHHDQGAVVHHLDHGQTPAHQRPRIRRQTSGPRAAVEHRQDQHHQGHHHGSSELPPPHPVTAQPAQPGVRLPGVLGRFRAHELLSFTRR